MAKHREGTDGWLWILPSLIIPLIVAAWAWAAHVSSEGERVAPNVRLAGIDISGLSPVEAYDEVAAREQEVLNTPVVIEVAGEEVELTAAEVGFDYRYLDTAQSVISARHDDGPIGEFAGWASTPFNTVDIHDVVVLDEDAARERFSREDFVVSQPVEPALDGDHRAEVGIVRGVDGVRVDIEALIAALKTSDIASGPVRVTAQEEVLSPTMTDESALAIAEEVNEKTALGAVVTVEGFRATLSPATLRRHIVSSVDDGFMNVSIDIEGLQADVEDAFPYRLGEFTPPTLEVVEVEAESDDAEPEASIEVVEEGSPPPVCCTRQSVDSLAVSILRGDSGPFELEARPEDDPTLASWADGSIITEPISTFTTYHPCCENRVVNIQTIADAVRGYYMLPGETLSLNDYVGPRTREKGYLPAGAIRNGRMTDEVGGGISQFVTTLFNAAFFGGLDLDEYQSHSIYFSRYPFGREATMSIPGPDLVLTNPTDHPILIWPTYDSTSITVTLYSTKNVDVVELEQRVSYRGQCRHSAIDRERTFSDGRVIVDTIVANYRPGDGLDCSGNPLPGG